MPCSQEHNSEDFIYWPKKLHGHMSRGELFGFFRLRGLHLGSEVTVLEAVSPVES